MPAPGVKVVECEISQSEMKTQGELEGSDSMMRWCSKTLRLQSVKANRNKAHARNINEGFSSFWRSHNWNSPLGSTNHQRKFTILRNQV
jgi:hypothetical protein